MNCTTVWKIIKKFQEIGTTLDQEGQGRKQTVHTPQLIKHQREAATQLLPKLQELGCSSWCRQIHYPGVGCYVAMRAKKCRKLLQDITEGMLPNLVFTDKKKFDTQQAVNQKNNRVWASSSMTEGRIVTRRQNPQSVMWAAVTATRRSPLLFVPTGVKLNSEWYISDILEGCLLPWAKQHFKDKPWTLQWFKIYSIVDSEENPLIHK